MIKQDRRGLDQGVSDVLRHAQPESVFYVAAFEGGE
jgi:hypothetical protein